MDGVGEMMLDIRDMNEFNPYYTPKASALKWKKSKAQKKYPITEIKDIIITQKDRQKFEVENYNAFKQQYEKSHKMIPILIRECDHKLIRGYEEVMLAKKLGITQLPYMEKHYNISRKPKGNKKYAIVDCTGKKLYLSGKAYSKFLKCTSICKERGLELVAMPMQNIYKVYDNTGQCILKKDGFTLNDLYNRLKKKTTFR